MDSADPGEVRINIVGIYGPSNSSDLVVGELERPVVLDSKAQVVVVSSLPLEEGDLVTTAGWGLFGPTGHLSNVLRRTDLEVSVGGPNEIVKTKVGRTISGIPVDTCSGDSGGPLLKWSDVVDAFVLHATLNGGGYDCILNTTNGEGNWNSVFPHIKWINSFAKGFAPEHEEVEEAESLPPAPIGKIVLQHSSSLIGDTLYEGSVFLDGRPVCDNAWDHNEALVVCRIFGYNRAVARTNSHFGGVEEGTQFAISDLRCKGDELHLLHCPHTALRSCGIAEVAGVTCIQNEDLSTARNIESTEVTRWTTTFPTTTTADSSSVEITWSNWASWSSCTKSCGGGRSERRRSCSGGSSCSGVSVEERLCSSNPCPAEMTWSNWGSWTTCSRTCGGGRSNRQRSCAGGTSCSGVRVEERLCNSNACPAEATWSNWGSWTSCTKTCGRGRSDRYRSCSGGSTCPGDQSEAKWCNTNTCNSQPQTTSRIPKRKPSNPLCPCPDSNPPCWCHATGEAIFNAILG